jgi:hypothetical protein
MDPYQVDSYYILNDLVRVTAAHPFLSDGKWVKVGELKVGNIVAAIDGTLVRVESLELIRHKATVYNLDIGGSGTFIADGFVVHNKNMAYSLAPCFECPIYGGEISTGTVHAPTEPHRVADRKMESSR